MLVVVATSLKQCVICNTFKHFNKTAFMLKSLKEVNSFLLVN